MCGIVGYLGDSNAKDIVLEGLHKLEYRGYDSAGISLYNLEAGVFDMFKDKGRVDHLASLLQDVHGSTVGIGHTRWATHGKVNRANAHPHLSSSKRFIVVHNGVIENYRMLKRDFLSHVRLESETDTEVIVHLIEMFAQTMEAPEAIHETLKLLEGSYALLVLDQQRPNRLIAAKNKSPLLIGRSDRGYIVASDLMALGKHSADYAPLEDYTMTVIERDKLAIYNRDYIEATLAFEPMDFDEDSAERGPYPHFMLKEIMEQPLVVRKILSHYFDEETLVINEAIVHDLRESDRIHILAAGTSMHAGLIGKHLFKILTGKPVEVHIASEFAYNPPALSDKPAFLMISQSGETADLRACMSHIREVNQPVVTLTNVRTSTLAREADHKMELLAGPEIAVASTKAYTAQLVVLTLLAYAVGKQRFNIKQELSTLAHAMETYLAKYERIDTLAKTVLTKPNAFYIGRGLDYAVALEAALKLKEISYIHAEGFAAGELKHGTIDLIEENTPVFGIISDKRIALNTRSNLDEVKSRGARTVIIALESLSEEEDDIVLPDVHPLLVPVMTVLPTQLIAYYAALHRGCDIDKPRNLAKSVTVE